MAVEVVTCGKKWRIIPCCPGSAPFQQGKPTEWFKNNVVTTLTQPPDKVCKFVVLKRSTCYRLLVKLSLERGVGNFLNNR